MAGEVHANEVCSGLGKEIYLGRGQMGGKEVTDYFGIQFVTGHGCFKANGKMREGYCLGVYELLEKMIDNGNLICKECDVNEAERIEVVDQNNIPYASD